MTSPRALMAFGAAATLWNFGSSETFPLRYTQPAPSDPLPITTPLPAPKHRRTR
jgi:hypothetical protein